MLMIFGIILTRQGKKISQIGVLLKVHLPDIHISATFQLQCNKLHQIKTKTVIIDKFFAYFLVQLGPKLINNGSNICFIEDILEAEAKASQLVAIIAIRIDEGPRLFKNVMQSNLDRGVDYRYLLLSSGEMSLFERFRKFQESLEYSERSFQGKLIDYIYVDSDLTLIDPAKGSRKGYILGDNASRGSQHLEITGKSLIRICDRFNYLWQVGRELD